METEGSVRERRKDDAGRRGGAGRAATTVLTPEEMRRVVLEEVALRRRRLGQLTPAQERAVESLLLTVADNISELVSGVAAVTARRGEETCGPTAIRLASVSPVHA